MLWLADVAFAVDSSELPESLSRDSARLMLMVEPMSLSGEGLWAVASDTLIITRMLQIANVACGVGLGGCTGGMSIC